MKRFFREVGPGPAPAPYCVFKPLRDFHDDAPEIVVCFERPEIISGLVGMAVFVTNDFEAVQAPFGAGCSTIVTWPLKYKKEGRLKAVLGGWDPSERPYLRTDEITFSMPYEMFEKMIERHTESFLSAHAWKAVKKRGARSRKTWDTQRNG